MAVLIKIFKESLYLAWQELWVNKLRTFLSLLGITIGIFCVISVFSVVDNLEHNVRNSVQELGDNVIYVQKWPWGGGFDGEYPWWKYFKRPVPNSRELKLISDKVRTASASCIYLERGDKTVRYKNYFIENTSLVGVSYHYDQLKILDFQKGRYFSLLETNAGHNVAIIGQAIADELFPPNTDPVGQEIKVEGKKIRVIGVTKKEGEDLMNMSLDNRILIPYNYMMKFVNEDSRHIEPFIMVKAKPNVSLQSLKDEVRGIMRSARKLHPKEEDDFALNQISLLTSQLNSMFGIINFAGWLIGGFSILVGGFGIANIMFVSVKERTNIIGIKKAIGAKSYFILLEFLTEAVILCIIGGAIGLVFVYGGIVLVKELLDFKLKLFFSNILTGLNISILIGIISGFWPAFQASRMDPVEAIRQS